MSKPNRTGRSKKGSKFAAVRFDIMDSPAFKTLPAEAVCIWLALRRRYNTHNNGQIPLSVREAAVAGRCSIATASRALKALIAAGFVKLTRNATFDQKRLAREWALTDYPMDDQPPTNEWRFGNGQNSKHSFTSDTDSSTNETMVEPDTAAKSPIVSPVTL